MKRLALGGLVAVVLLPMALVSTVAAQVPPAGGEPAPAKAPAAEPGLPAGHPPIGRPERRPDRRPTAPVRRPGQGKSAQELLAELRERQAALRQQALAKKKFPRDDHGNCIGQGPNDRPKDINLMHGWLGTTEDAAKLAKRPPLPGYDSEVGLWENLKRQLPFWKWRLTPYPYRYENHDDHCDPRNQPVPLLANVVNLALLLFVLARLGKKPLAGALQKRRDGIMGDIERARSIKESARARLDEYEDDLDHLDERLATLREHYALEGDTEEKRLLEEMSEARDRMIEDVEFRLAQAGKTTRDALGREALSQALSAAEELCVANLKAADHDRIEREYLGQLAVALAEHEQARRGATAKEKKS